jgi:hypothetical protein
MAEENFRPMGMHRFPYRPDSEVPVFAQLPAYERLPLVAEGAQVVITAINPDAERVIKRMIERKLEESLPRENEMDSVD